LLDEEEWRRLGKINMPQLEVSSLGRVRIYDQFGVRDVVTFVEEGQLCVSETLPNGVYCAKTVFFLMFHAFYRNQKPGMAHRPINGNWLDVRLDNLDVVYNGERVHYRDGYVRTLDLRHNGMIEIVETGQVFASAAEVARSVGGARSNISMCLAGKLKTHKGFSYRYV